MSPPLHIVPFRLSHCPPQICVQSSLSPNPLHNACPVSMYPVECMFSSVFRNFEESLTWESLSLPLHQITRVATVMTVRLTKGRETPSRVFTNAGKSTHCVDRAVDSLGRVPFLPVSPHRCHGWGSTMGRFRMISAPDTAQSRVVFYRSAASLTFLPDFLLANLSIAIPTRLRGGPLDVYSLAPSMLTIESDGHQTEIHSRASPLGWKRQKGF